MKTLELADIDSINFGGHNGSMTSVRGYQNFDIYNDSIFAINNPTNKRPWTDTKVKSEFFEKIFAQVNPNSYADFGSNLGYYVFYSAIKNVKSVGVDYNKEYIGVCESIAARHDLVDATFLHTNLESWCKQDDHYDFMTVFNVIHHLYNRTETYMDMMKLIEDFASKADVILFEVPTEKDSKGHKWTMDTGYTEELFYNSAQKLFNSVEKIPGQTEHRPYYLCS